MNLKILMMMILLDAAFCLLAVTLRFVVFGLFFVFCCIDVVSFSVFPTFTCLQRGFLDVNF